MGHLLGRNTWGPPAGCWCPGVVGVAVDGNACDGSRGRQEREDEKEDVDEKGGTERRGRSATSQRRSSRLSLLPPASSLHMNVRVGNPCSLDVNKSVAAPSGVAFSRQRTNERTNERTKRDGRHPNEIFARGIQRLTSHRPSPCPRSNSLLGRENSFRERRAPVAGTEEYEVCTTVARGGRFGRPDSCPAGPLRAAVPCTAAAGALGGHASSPPAAGDPRTGRSPTPW